MDLACGWHNAICNDHGHRWNRQDPPRFGVRLPLPSLSTPARVVGGFAGAAIGRAHLECLAHALALPATHDPRSQALGYLEQTAGLLALDNFEPLLPEGAGVVELLLSRAAQLRVLVTSRIPLRIASEQLLALTPLAVQAEQPDDLAPAVHLFADRARHVYLDFRLTPARLAEVQRWMTPRAIFGNALRCSKPILVLMLHSHFARTATRSTA